MLPRRAQVVCLAVRDTPGRHVERLASMLERHMPVPFDLACVVDHPRAFSAGVRTIDASGWPPPREGMRATTYKLGLYDRERMPFDEFLYFDTSLVIHRDLTPLLEFAFESRGELAVVRDWNHDTYNTCVMRIRPGGRLTAIPEAYAAGERFESRVPGDQDFVTSVIRARGLESCVATFPDGMIQSYKSARHAEKSRRGAGRRLLEEAIVVKFHGEPKMDQLLDPRYRLRQMRTMGNPFHRNAWFWVRELRQRWR